MGVHKYKYNWDFFKKDSEELYYFWGFVAADGYLSDNEIEIGINEKDVSLLKHFRDLIAPDKPLYKKESTRSFTLKISCKGLMKEFKDFFSMKSNLKRHELRFPNIPEQYQKDFIRGYVDGNGCIDTTKGHKGEKIYIGPRLRILGGFEFLKGLNNVTKNFVPHKTNAVNKKGKEDVCSITYNFSTASNLLKWIYDESIVFLERKKMLAKEVTKSAIR